MLRRLIRGRCGNDATDGRLDCVLALSLPTRRRTFLCFSEDTAQRTGWRRRFGKAHPAPLLRFLCVSPPLPPPPLLPPPPSTFIPSPYFQSSPVFIYYNLCSSAGEQQTCRGVKRASHVKSECTSCAGTSKGGLCWRPSSASPWPSGALACEAFLLLLFFNAGLNLTEV